MLFLQDGSKVHELLDLLPSITCLSPSDTLMEYIELAEDNNKRIKNGLEPRDIGKVVASCYKTSKNVYFRHQRGSFKLEKGKSSMPSECYCLN